MSRAETARLAKLRGLTKVHTDILEYILPSAPTVPVIERMELLILMRHGKAAAVAADGGDRSRPLTSRGAEESRATAVWLDEVGFVPDFTLMSPSTRTVQTWLCAAETWPDVASLSVSTLYLSDAETVMEALTMAPPNARTVLLIGHNPGLQDLVVKLADQGGAPIDEVDRLMESFPEATACVFRMSGEQVAWLEAVYSPPKSKDSAPRWVFFRRGDDEGAGT